MRDILTDAVAIGDGYARANTIYPRDPGARIYQGSDSEWVMGFANKDTAFLKDGARRFDSRLWMHYNAIVVSPNLLSTTPGVSTSYLTAIRDENGNYLNGGKNYRLTVPANVPVKRFWAVTAYYPISRSLLKSDGAITVGSQRNPEENSDGSVDVFFGPGEAPAGQEKNWIRTESGKGFFVVFRFYGPTEGYINKTWVLNDFVLVD